MANVPDDYLLWLLDNGVHRSFPDVYDYIIDNLDSIKTEKED